MSTTTDLQSLKINYLTQAQYDAASQAGTLDENQLYLTPITNTNEVVYASDSTDVDISDAVGLAVFSGDTFDNNSKVGVIPLEEGEGGWLDANLQWTNPEIADVDGLSTALSGKQATLVSGTNIKTINSTSLLGSGDITVQSEIASTTVAISVADWSSTTTCTKSVTGVTASNNVIVTPAPSSILDWTGSGVYCSAQAENSLTFTCENTPSEAISVNILIIS